MHSWRTGVTVPLPANRKQAPYFTKSFPVHARNDTSPISATRQLSISGGLFQSPTASKILMTDLHLAGNDLLNYGANPYLDVSLLDRKAQTAILHSETPLLANIQR